jgi:hypothetical protein
MSTSHHPALTGSFGKAASRLGAWRHTRATTVYQITDRLHDGRTARVPGHQISATVSAWLAELDAQSPLVDDLSRAVNAGDWPATHAISEHLSVDIAVAA